MLLLAIFSITIVCSSYGWALGCEQGWTRNNDNDQCYRLFDSQVNYPTAVAECSKASARLPMPKTESENNFIRDMINDSGLLPEPSTAVIWLDMQLTDGTWQWGDGTILGNGWNNWRPGEPNGKDLGEKCAWLDHNGKWWDYLCDRNQWSTKRIFYMCTKPIPDCEQGWTRNNDNDQCYRLFDSQVNYPRAVAECSKASARLPMPKTESENNFIRDMIIDSGLFPEPSTAVVWLDMKLTDGTWQWGDGTIPGNGWDNWRPGEPNGKDLGEKCAWLDHNGKWWDYLCDRNQWSTKRIFYMCTKPISEKCNVPIDLVFMVDTSRSIRRDDLNTAMSFVSTVTDRFHIYQDTTHVSVIQIAHIPKTLFSLSAFQSNDGVKQAIKDKQIFFRGSTKVEKALNTVAKGVFGPFGPSREWATRVLVFLTDGRPNNPSAALAAARAIKDAGVNLFTVGVGDNVDVNMLDSMATNNSFSFHAPDYQRMEDIVGSLAKKACEKKIMEYR